MVGQTVEGFAAYARAYVQPEFFAGNSAAFAARLKLLDSAPAGARALIATFAFDNGEVTRRLARHVCLAALRGVRVELLVDSKYGSRPGKPDVFDKSDDKQLAEELFQYMANCGAAVYVHNELESYVEVLGSRVPNFFLEARLDGKKVGLPLALSRLNYLFGQAVDITEEELSRLGVNTDVGRFFRHFLGTALDFGKYVALRHLGLVRAEGTTAESLGRAFDRVVRDPLWDSLTAERLRAVLPRLERRFRNDSEFARIIEVVRRYNRLNHRKLFLVESGNEGCLLLGGRNLGDHYLAEGKDSFYDGDVLLCRGQGGDAAFDAAKESFEELKRDRDDPFLGRPGDNRIIRVAANPRFEFRNLIVPQGLGLPDLVRGEGYKGKLTEKQRTLLPAMSWPDREALHGDFPLAGSRNWHLELTGWNPSRDEARQALLNSIRADSREIYLETPYAEFDGELRSALEGALARGVRVTLVTNSLLTSDGASKLIRLLMMHWMETTQARYPQLFMARFTSFRFAHMTHFKGAAFACQGDHRFYLVGSHNFHPRSGYADKEHMLSWEEPSDCNARLDSVSLVKARREFYAARPGSLDSYPNLLAELTEAIRFGQGGRDEGTVLAQGVRARLFEPTEQGLRLRDGKRVRRFLGYLDSSGLHDLIARIF